MSQVTRTTAKGYFNTNDVPTEQQFANLIDSLRWYDEKADFRVNETHIQFKREGEATWNDLIALSELQGPQGDQGIQGIQGIQGEQGPQGLQGELGPSGISTESICIALSDETSDLAAGTAKATFRMPYGVNLTAVRASVNTAPSGSTLVVNIKENGVSILSTNLSIDSGEKTSTTAASAAVISDSTLANDSEITIDIVQVGAVTAGKGLKVTFIGTKI